MKIGCGEEDEVLHVPSACMVSSIALHTIECGVDRGCQVGRRVTRFGNPGWVVVVGSDDTINIFAKGSAAGDHPHRGRPYKWNRARNAGECLVPDLDEVVEGVINSNMI